MATTTQVPTTQQVAPKAKRIKRTFSAGFDGPDGSSLRVTRRDAKDGSAKTWVTHRASKAAKAQRGQTEVHTSPENAQAAMETLIEKAIKLGWVKRERVGFVAKPDAFSELPTPPKKSKK